MFMPKNLRSDKQCQNSHNINTGFPQKIIGQIDDEQKGTPKRKTETSL